MALVGCTLPYIDVLPKRLITLLTAGNSDFTYMLAESHIRLLFSI
jgi:hypothetical protein